LRWRQFVVRQASRIGCNNATGKELTGAGNPTPKLLMYPRAFTTSRQPDTLSPKQFRYAIMSPEAPRRSWVSMG